MSIPRTVAALIIYLIISLATAVPPAIWHSINDPNDALVLKHRRLDNAKSPKIVFIGGSNISFGIDSAAIQYALKRDVVNMGNGASLGLRYQLEEVKDNIGNGDLFVVMPEYENFTDSAPKVDGNGRLNGSSELIYCIILYPRILKWVLRVYIGDPDGPFDALDNFFCFLRRRSQPKALVENIIGKLLDSNFHISLRKIFEQPKIQNILEDKPHNNVYGDFIAHLGLPSPGLHNYDETFYYPYHYCDQASEVLSNFGKEAEKKNAHLVFLPAPAPENSMYMWKLDDVYEHLNKLQHMSVLAIPRRYTFPRSQFFNSVYHLNEEGRKKRTERIIQDLSKYIRSLDQADSKTGNR